MDFHHPGEGIAEQERSSPLLREAADVYRGEMSSALRGHKAFSRLLLGASESAVRDALLAPLQCGLARRRSIIPRVIKLATKQVVVGHGGTLALPVFPIFFSVDRPAWQQDSGRRQKRNRPRDNFPFAGSACYYKFWSSIELRACRVVLVLMFILFAPVYESA